MKSKTEFYQAYFEALQKKGFTVKPSTSADYVADIYLKDKLVAFYSKTDSIIKNPFIEVKDKTMEQIQTLAKSIAAACGICLEKPFDEANAVKLQGNVFKINEHNGVVLACKQHPLFGWVLSTYRKDAASENVPIQREYYYNKEAAFESYSVRSGLIDEKRLFTETELKVIYTGLVKMRTIDGELSDAEMNEAGQLIDRIEEIIPELQKKDRLLDFSRFFNWEQQIER